MIRLVIALGIVGVVSSFALGFTEDFESFDMGVSVAGSPDWSETGLGEYFETNATVSSVDPSVLGNRYADLSRNTHSPTDDDAWLWQNFDGVSGGMLVTEFDTRFEAAGILDSCTIFLCGPDRTPGYSPDDQAVGISVDIFGLRVHDGGWRVVTNFNVENEKWYHARITVDLDAGTWQLALGRYIGDTHEALTTVAYGTNQDNDTFTFVDPTVTEIGMIEFSTTPDIMLDDDVRGFHVDNISVPEPATLSLLSVAGFLAMRRRK